MSNTKCTLEILDTVLVKLKDGFVPNKIYLLIPNGGSNQEFIDYWCGSGFHKFKYDENMLESN